MRAGWSGSAAGGPITFELTAPRALPAGAPAAFLDRDGTLNAGVPDPESGGLESPLRVEDVRLLPGVSAAARHLSDAGYALVCASNQPAAAKGKVGIEQLRDVHERVIELLAGAGVRIFSSRLCLHHPRGSVDGLARTCDCRKPAPGMLLEAARSLELD
ncbi:MAG: HAD-IIIA family hydrolase, partial [Solirubrobacteraceae bacterium]